MNGLRRNEDAIKTDAGIKYLPAIYSIWVTGQFFQLKHLLPVTVSKIKCAANGFMYEILGGKKYLFFALV